MSYNTRLIINLVFMKSINIITMSTKELSRLEIIQKTIDKEITEKKASEIISLSIRQIQRLKRMIRGKGPKGIIHGNRGKPSNRKIPNNELIRIKNLLNKHYYDFHPTHASEKLEENHNIKRDPKTVNKILTEMGLWKPRVLKGEEHRNWRLRKANFGEMVQLDGSDHDWFEERAPKCTLIITVDDATSAITHAKFDIHEGVFPIFDFWKEYLVKLGKPMSIYLDRFSTYKMTQEVAKSNHDTKTQFQRALNEFNIEDISAYSSQAKGRVETTFKTLQNRLVKEMRLKNISTMEKANKYLLNEFIPWFNKKYAIEPRGKSNFHQPLTRQEKAKLIHMLSRHEKRVIQNDFTVSFKTQWYQLTEKQPVIVCKRDKVVVEEYRDNSVQIRLRGKYLNFKPIEKGKQVKKATIPWVLVANTREKVIC